MAFARGPAAAGPAGPCHAPAQVAQRINAAILKAAIPLSVLPQPTLTDADYQELLELGFQQAPWRI